MLTGLIPDEVAKDMIDEIDISKETTSSLAIEILNLSFLVLKRQGHPPSDIMEILNKHPIERYAVANAITAQMLHCALTRNAELRQLLKDACEES